jgi:hypothetical protein
MATVLDEGVHLSPSEVVGGWIRHTDYAKNKEARLLNGFE